MESKNSIIDVLKGIAIILVIYGHVIQRTMLAHDADFFLNPAFKVIYTFHMPIFFFLSGYLISGSLRKKRVGEVFKSRFKALLIPYIIWGILGVFTFYFLNLIDGKGAQISQLPAEAVDQLLTNPTVWFLYTIFILSCILLCSYQLANKFGAWVYVVTYVLLMAIPYNNDGALYYIQWFYLFYLVGYFFHASSIKITHKLAHTLIFLGALLVLVYCVGLWTKNDFIYIHKMHVEWGNFSEVSRMIYRYLAGFSGIIVIFYIGYFLSNTKAQRWLGYVGMYSLDIYLVQRYLLEGLYPRIVSKMPTNFDFNGPLFLYCFVPLLTAVFIGICIAVSQVFIRRKAFLNQLLLGNRN